ncbi:MAG: hypothetical protein PVH22_02325 [Desulfobacteraceae bacterium]
MRKFKSLTFKFHRRHQGQAMVEFCVAAPLLVLLLWSVLYLTEMYIVKHETLVAARYGTWLLSRYDNIPQNSVDLEEVNGLISKNFFKNKSEGLLIETQHVGGDQDDNGSSDDLAQASGSGSFVDGIVGIIGDNLMGSDSPTIYSLKIQYDYPRLFGAVDLREEDNEHFTIESEHSVLGNSWDGQRVEVHDMVEMVGEAISDILDLL